MPSQITITKCIAAAPERVFEVFCDLEHAAQHLSAVSELRVLTPGPPGKGTRFTETRSMFGKQATEELEITAFQRPQSYTIECTSCGAHYATVHDFEPDGEGTRLTMVMTITPRTFFAKLTSPVGKLMIGPMRKMIERDFDELARLAELEPASA